MSVSGWMFLLVLVTRVVPDKIQRAVKRLFECVYYCMGVYCFFNYFFTFIFLPLSCISWIFVTEIMKFHKNNWSVDALFNSSNCYHAEWLDAVCIVTYRHTVKVDNTDSEDVQHCSSICISVIISSRIPWLRIELRHCCLCHSPYHLSSFSGSCLELAGTYRPTTVLTVPTDGFYVLAQNFFLFILYLC